jgi:hypothetical protein
LIAIVDHSTHNAQTTMPTLRERIDLSSITISFPTLPKGKKRATAIGFCGNDPVATIEGSGNTAPPWRWINGKAEQLTFQDIKKIGASSTSMDQIVGLWYTPKHDERALVWTRDGDHMQGVELHPEKWQKSNAMACADGQQLGYGYQTFTKDPCRVLLWQGTRESMVILTGPDPAFDVMGTGVEGGIQVGSYGGSVRKHACLWRGTTDSYLDLHPASDYVGSEALGVGDGQQVGVRWDAELAGRAALWSGSPGSFVNLAPKGFVRSRASHCARGFQAGWVGREDQGMLIRAALWNGSEDDWLDLQDFLPSPWTASWVCDLDVSGDRIRIMGTAQQAVMSGGYEVNAGQVPVIWEARLLIAEPARVADSASAVKATPVAESKSTAESTEQRISKAAEDFGQAIVTENFKEARALLAPWLQKQVTAKQLQTVISKNMIEDIPPEECSAAGNDTTLDELRSHYREYYKDDPTRTLTTTKEFGTWGPPSIVIADEITDSNFRQWMWLDFTPDPESDTLVDYCLRLYVIVVEVNGVMKIGYIEPGD